MSRNIATLAHYEQTAPAYAQAASTVDMSHAIQMLVATIRSGGVRILDAGCGTGRDSLAMMSMGLDPVPVDGCKAMCGQAARLLGVPVKRERFQDMVYDAKFDGVFACASLLHLEDDELKDAIARLLKALKPGGTLFASFMMGDGVRFENGCLFNDVDPEKLDNLLHGTGAIRRAMWGGDEAWVNYLIHKPLTS